MDLNIFATQATQSGTTKTSSGVLGANGLANALGNNAGGAAFWNVILGNLAETGEVKTDINLDNNETKDVKKETVDLALLQLALLGQDADQSLDEKLSELSIERLANNSENRVDQLTKLIDHLTSGLPSAALEGGESIEELVSRLTQRLENLEAGLEAFRTGDFEGEGAPFQALIATGLNPTQLTKITSRIEEVETKLGRELTVEDLIVGVGNIIPVPGSAADDEDQFSSTDALQMILAKSEESDGEITDNSTIDEKVVTDIALAIPNDKIQDLKVSNQKLLGMIEAMQTAAAVNSTSAFAPANGNVNTGEGLQRAASQPLSNAEFNALFKGNTSAGVANGKGNNSQMGNVNAAMTTVPAAQMGALNFADALSALASNNILSDALGYNVETGTPFSNVMQAAHVATSASVQAGHPHPATSMVSATINKAAQKGDSSQITLQLDPPELGRVEVRLQFGTDKSVQAHLFVEKPETLLMLQRDVLALEKALQDAGLETDSGSLNFEMAENNEGFNSNKDGNGAQGQSGQSANGESEEDLLLIETTMTWDVDPETGHVHYSILA